MLAAFYLIFVVAPILDAILGTDGLSAKSNPSPIMRAAVAARIKADQAEQDERRWRELN